MWDQLFGNLDTHHPARVAGPAPKRRRVSIAVTLLLCAGLTMAGAPRTGALPLLSHHGRWLTDARGRVVILHGVQVDKYMPSQPVEWIDLSRPNVRFIAAEGFNAARVSMAYAGFEPRLGHFDTSYLDSYLRFDRELAHAGVYDLLDMMQGQYSEAVGGWGFPNWMTFTDGVTNNHHPFPQGYEDNPAEQAAWDNFWANRAAGDGVGLQNHYAHGLRRIAQAFSRAPGLLALEILNEPWPGSRWPTCFSTIGCPSGGFDQTSFTHFYRRIIPALRSADPRHLIAYEPNLLYDYGYPTRLGPLPDPNLLFAFHNYCLTVALGLPPTPANLAKCAASEQATLVNAEQRARQGGGALLMDEWGNTTDVAQMQQIEQDADQHLVGWLVWAYEDCCHSPAAIVRDGTLPPTSPGNLNLTELNALVRPYPQLVAGTPVSWSYDPTGGKFRLVYSTHRLAGGAFPAETDTEVELPALRYPTGYRLRVRGASVVSAPDANLLRLDSRPGAAAVRLTVVPARHHPSAPGPFSWPAGTRVLAQADCPAGARYTIRLPHPAGSSPIARVAIYIDGRSVAVLPGSAGDRITLPPGLADGTVVRLMSTMARGARQRTTEVLNHCSPRPV